jgi:hypothetical protein
MSLRAFAVVFLECHYEDSKPPRIGKPGGALLNQSPNFGIQAESAFAVQSRRGRARKQRLPDSAILDPVASW